MPLPPSTPAPTDATTRFDALLRAAAAMLETCQLTVSLDGVVLVASSNTDSILGWNRKDLVGKTLASIFSESDPSGVDALMRAQEGRAEFALRLPTGATRHVEVWIGSVPEGVELEGRIVSVRDIDARRAHEDESSRRASWFDSVLSSAPMLVFVLDRNFVPLVPMSSAARVFRRTFSGDGIGAFVEVVHPFERATVRAAMADVLASPGIHKSVRFRVQGDDHQWRWFETEVVNQLDHPVVQAIVGSVRDVTSKVRAEDHMRRSEERYALIARASDDALWDWDLGGSSVYLSPRFYELVGLGDPGAGEAAISAWLDRIHPEESGVVGNVLQAQIQGGADPVRQQFRLRHEDGSWRWIECRSIAVRGPNQRATRLAGSLTDITDRVLRDGSTGLPTRAVLLDRIGRCIERARRDQNQLFSVLVVALERFDVLRGDLDRNTAERLLARVARRAEDSLRGTDSVARLDGTRLGVLLEGIGDVAGAHRAADRLHDAFSRPIEIDGREFFSDVQIGLALWNKAAAGPESLLTQAESALSRAILGGAQQTAIYDPEEHKRALDRIALEAELRRALQDGGLSVVFQPIVRIEGEVPVGAEALCRWTSARRGFVPPSTFIPVAESSDLIGDLDRWVLRESVRHSAEWRDAYISVNLSARELRKQTLVSDVARALERHSFDPSRLRLELTETALVENADEAQRTLKAFRDMGIHLALDDFGTGYASLAYLRRFPFDVIKIDRSFVMNLETDRHSREIATAILAMARSLDLDVVAEGVETVQQRDLLRELGCCYGQGYLWSKPVPPDQIRSRFA